MALRIGLVFVGVVVLIALGYIFLRQPQPEIILPAELILEVGPFNVTNTLIAAWLAMITLIVVTFLATRSMQMVPSGLQNFVEGIIEFLYNQVVEIAGEENGRKFFVVCATFFLFILVANWISVLPFFNAIGRTEDVGWEIFHEIEEYYHENHAFSESERFAAFFMDEIGGFGFVMPNETSRFEFEFHEGERPEVALDRYIIALAEAFTDFEANLTAEQELAPPVDVVMRARDALEADADAPKLLPGDEAHGVPSPALGILVGGIDFPGQKLALNEPIFRGAYTDANNTIALALVSFFFVEMWGLQALGIGYLGKFFNFSSPIMFFVGFLELISEFIRIVSFSFRLLGNMFAGEVLVLMLPFLVPLVIVDVIFGLELFVGFIQATVFGLLTLVFAVGAVEHHGDDEGHGEHHEGVVPAH